VAAPLPCHPSKVRELRHDDARIRRKAVVAARELMGAPEKLVQCIAAGVTPALIALLQVKCVRAAAACALSCCAPAMLRAPPPA
jgi:hypothetical protein